MTGVGALPYMVSPAYGGRRYMYWYWLYPLRPLYYFLFQVTGFGALS